MLVFLHEPRSYARLVLALFGNKLRLKSCMVWKRAKAGTMVDFALGMTLVGCKWVNEVKTKFGSSITTRLESNGHTQEYGINFEEIFASLALLTSIRTLIIVATGCR